MNSIDYTKPILLFDGYCNLCNNSVKFVLKHEKTSEIVFASLESTIGVQILKQYHINSTEIDSLVLIQHKTVYVKSSAALRLTKYLKGLYPLAYILLIIPPFIRNWAYDYIARHRYRWFGKSDTCMMPDSKQKHRFL